MKGTILLVLFLSLFLTFPVSAQMPLKEGTDSAVVAITPSPPEYFLPYPGMLPDNPLYFLKAARDSIISLLISDMGKKADFHLLQADKSVQSGVQLIKKDKKPLALKSFDNAETYFADAVTEVQSAKKQKKEVNDLLRRLSQSGEKHQKILTETALDLSGDEKKKVLEHMTKMQELTQKVDRLRSQ